MTPSQARSAYEQEELEQLMAQWPADFERATAAGRYGLDYAPPRRRAKGASMRPVRAAGSPVGPSGLRAYPGGGKKRGVKGGGKKQRNAPVNVAKLRK